jgi:hypothetical protein
MPILLFNRTIAFSKGKNLTKTSARLAVICTFLLATAHVSVAQNSRLTLATFNDNWGGGFTEVKDDYRSFGFLLDADFLAFNKTSNLRLKYSGFTDKFVADSSRLDEIELKAKYTIATIKSHHYFQGIAGLYAVGNLGGESVQNTVHSGVGVAKVELPYSAKSDFYGIIGGAYQSDIPLFGPETKKGLSLNPIVEYFWSPNYLQSIKLALGLKYGNLIGDYLQLNIGYNQQDVFSNTTRQAAASVEQGFYAEYALKLGMVNFAIRVYPENRFSIGTFGINLLNGKKRQTIEYIDLIAEFGALTGNNGMYQRYLWNKLTPHSDHFQLDLHHQFWSITSQNPDLPPLFGHFRQMSLGINYTPIALNNKFQMLPYLSLRMGHRVEKLYPAEDATYKPSVNSLVAIGEIGVRIKLPASLIHKNCYYGGTAGYSYMAPFYNSELPKNVEGYAFAQPISAFNFGAFVMIEF